MKLIEQVRIFYSESNIKDGHDLGPGFGIIVSPHPKTEHELNLVGDALRACMLGLQKEDME